MNKNKKYWFILGNFPLISTTEILEVLSLPKKIKSPPKNILEVESKKINAPELITQIGGTIKIGESISVNLTESKLIDTTTKILSTVKGKINFGFSAYEIDNEQIVRNWAKKIKENLREKNRNARFIFKKSTTLSSVTVEKNKLIKKGAEFLVIKNKNGTFNLAKTLAVQPFENFSNRDFGRPNRDDKSGMIPPKLALMMINIGQGKKKSILLDPFCGSGTILNEALLLGYQKIYGSDISKQATQNTKKNLEWLETKTSQKPEIKIQQCEIQKIQKFIKANSIGSIISEPYMGQPLNGKEKKIFLITQTKELKQLYLEAFSQFAIILKKGNSIVFTIPRFKHQNDWITIDCQKEIEKMGFTTETLLKINDLEKKHLLYYRPGQKVGREIWKFKKK